MSNRWRALSALASPKLNGATHAGFSARNQRPAQLIDPLGPHTLVVDFDVKPTHLEACHVGHQKGIGAHAKERPHITGKQRLTLRFGQILRGERLRWIAFHGGSKRMVAQNFTAQVIHGEDRHGSPTPHAICMAILHLRCNIVWLAVANRTQHGIPIEQLAPYIAGFEKLLFGGLCD
jgi:hypothetical protein